MNWFLRKRTKTSARLVLLVSVVLGAVAAVNAQSASKAVVSESGKDEVALSGGRGSATTELARNSVTPLLARYFDPLQGASSNDLVRRALSANAELAATRLEIERARARLRQAGLRPNPTLDFEQTTGRFTGSAGEQEISVGLAVPLELGGKRRRRIELARAEFEAAEAEVADRERRLANEVRAFYAEALAAIRELGTLEELNNLDLQTTRFIQARVNEGETAPIELNQLRVEVDRLRSRRALVEGRLQAALLRLKSLTGVPAAELIRLREDIATPGLAPPPASLESAIEIALRSRPDLKLAQLNVEVAQAGLRLARSYGVPDVTPFTRYSQVRSVFDNTPVGVLRDRDKLLTFGVSVGIPVFNRNQGAKAEATTAINQAERRREFVEAVVRTEVQSSFARYEAARAAVSTFEQGVIPRSSENIRTIRAAYQIGAFSITDLLVEQRRLVDAQREFTEALAEQYRALADIHAAIGARPDQP
ncbi:MAG TPA: TolC family protein [Pyrinomonadaceae bacterium]|jgi:outer membrane protein, heavy metal efflux system